jgi:aminoglycoside/choline kinase family phosphotransferase
LTPDSWNVSMRRMEADLEKIREIVASSLNISSDKIEISVLSGDASDRRFYRASIPGGETRIVMQLDPTLPAPEDPDKLPFINILTHLALCKAAVPKLDLYDPALGILILEDLGEMTLEEHVRHSGLDASLPLYQESIRELLTLQITGTRKKCEHCMAFHHSFDVEKLMWELDFFIQHTVEGYLGREVSPSDLYRVRQGFQNLCRLIAEEPGYFTHRDYHSRNLMVRDGKIGIVDFQDARLGPLQYDLCSLLRDSYVLLPDETVDELIAFYIKEKDRMEKTVTDPQHFRRIFDLTSVQRNLKAAGTFGYMATVKNKKGYLKYLPDTFEYVRKNLQKYPELDDLRSGLGRCLPEIL